MVEYIIKEGDYNDEIMDELVRCKDCKWYEIAELKRDGTDDKRYKPSVCTISGYAEPRDEKFYCADGIKRNEVEE